MRTAKGMHGTGGEWGDAGEQEQAGRGGVARALFLPLSQTLIAIVLAAGVVAGLLAIVAVAIPAWAKIAILFAILAPASVLALIVVGRRSAGSDAPAESRSRLLRRAADAVDEPRAVLGPD